MHSESLSNPWWLAPAITPSGVSSDHSAEWQGLSSEQARERLAQHGPNQINPHKPQALLWQFLSRFKNPLVIILLVASAVSAATGDVTNFFIIATMVLTSVTLDFVQEYRADRTAEKLRQSVTLHTTVRRDGQPCPLPASEVVIGDVLLLSAGDLIAADGWVLESRDFFVNQALLTGEPYPVEKKPGMPDAANPNLAQAGHAVFMGTSVISGSATVCVARTGSATALGDIANRISQPATPTSFDLGTRRFGMLIMRLTVLMVLFVLMVNTFSHKPLLESFLFAVALAVGLTPELLPMIVSITLARGAMRMARMQMIVKRQSAIQDLGSMDVLCTDKTGTLTEARIRLEKTVNPQGRSSTHVLELAWLNSHFETGLKSPLDAAILEAATLDSIKGNSAGWQKTDEVPFDFERRRVSVLLAHEGQQWLIVKGAPDDVLRQCTHCTSGDAGEPQPFDASCLRAVQAQCHALEADGLRVLGIAWRVLPSEHAHATVHDETGLVFAGFAAFIDPPKESAASALQALQNAGVAIKVVTGDSDLVTRHVCAQLGIPVTGVLLGSEMEHLDNQTLSARAEKTNLFCRVNPAQKERVIRALRSRGHVVGYLGDGINDAPSLHAADVGLSVDTAVDVAKEAADMILLKHDLHVLHAGVLEGRRTFGNIMKYIMMGTSSNFGNMFSMAGAAVFLPFLPMLPTQILLNNILYDISEIPIPLDEVDANDLTQPRVLNLDFIRNFMLVIGSISSVFDFLTFYVLLVVMKADEKLFQTGWFIESLCTQVLVIFVIRTRLSPIKSRAHPLLVFTSLAVVAVAITLPLTPLGTHFGFVPPPAQFYAILAGMVLGYLLIVEVTKRVFYHFNNQRLTLRST